MNNYIPSKDEIWKDIIDYEGLYQISNLGNVKSLKYSGGNKEKIIKGNLLNNGYLTITLCKVKHLMGYYICFSTCK